MNKTVPAGLLVVTTLLAAGCSSHPGGHSTGGSSSGSAGTSGSASGSASASSGASTTTTSPSSSAPTSSASSSASSSGTATSSTGGAVARCHTSDLRITVGRGEGGAGSSYVPIHLTNTSGHACRTGGFGGVSLVDSPRAEPLGAPADRTQASTAKPLVLAPGRRATATLQIADAGNYSASRCQPTPTTGLRVYPPNETQSVDVPHRATACASPTVHLLTLRPYRLG